MLKSHISKFEEEAEKEEIERGEKIDLKVFEKKIFKEEKNFFLEEIERLKEEIEVLEEKKKEVGEDFIGFKGICEELEFLEKQIGYLEKQVEVVEMDLKVAKGKNFDIYLKSVY